MLRGHLRWPPEHFAPRVRLGVMEKMIPGIYLPRPGESRDQSPFRTCPSLFRLVVRYQADQRDYGIGVQILRELGVQSVRLLSNNPRKLVAIQGYGLSVAEWLPLEIPPSALTMKYLTTKRNKLGHVLNGV